MEYIKEFIKHKECKGEKAIYRVNDNHGYTYYSDDYVMWLEQQLRIHDVSGSLRYSEHEVDLAYLAGVLNVSGIDGLQKEIERLKGLGKKPHDIIIEGRQQ